MTEDTVDTPLPAEPRTHPDPAFHHPYCQFRREGDDCTCVEGREAAATEPRPDPALDGHRHAIIAALPEAHRMEGRALVLGRLLEPLPNAPHETHCLHVTTPFKREIVFGLWEWDLAWMAALAEAQNGEPLNARWVTNQAASMRRAGEIEAEREGYGLAEQQADAFAARLAGTASASETEGEPR